jgi:hypothetical protein
VSATWSRDRAQPHQQGGDGRLTQPGPPRSPPHLVWERVPGHGSAMSAITELTPGTIGELPPLGTGFSLPSPGPVGTTSSSSLNWMSAPFRSPTTTGRTPLTSIRTSRLSTPWIGWASSRSAEVKLSHPQPFYQVGARDDHSSHWKRTRGPQEATGIACTSSHDCKSAPSLYLLGSDDVIVDMYLAASFYSPRRTGRVPIVARLEPNIPPAHHACT